jgi:hypothetical protein
MPSIDITNVVAPIPSAAAALSVTLPGGASVGGIPLLVGPDPLTQAFAASAAVGPAMAPLMPAFRIIDAVLSLKDFVEAVPKVLVNPGAIIEAGAKFVTKIAALAGIIPQLSVPLMLVGVIDIVINLLIGLVAVLIRIQEQEQQIAEASSLVSTVPALGPIVAAATAQTDVARANVLASVATIGPIMLTINLLCGLAGLPPIDAAPAGGTTAELIASMQGVVNVLATARAAVPIP